jgi:D-alanyl-D-alanine carboxypeptidase
MLGTLALLCFLSADAVPVDVASLDRSLASVYRDDAPGATVAVMRDAVVVFERSYGLASVEPRVPLRPDMAMPIGSVTKPFTAALALMLVHDGKLRLDAPLHGLVTGWPAEPVVTVDHLLTHRSGIKPFTELPQWQEPMRKDPSAGVAEAEILALLAKEPVVFAPGSAEAYSGSNYLLLAKVIEAVAGKPYDEVLRERILLPLGMSRTSCNAAPSAVAPVKGYRKHGATFAEEPFLGPARCLGGGGLASTAGDLARWGLVLGGSRALAPESKELMTSAPRVGASYTRGWEAWEHAGHRFVWHGGYTWGFLSAVVHDVEHGVTVALVSNNVSPVEEIDAQYLAKRLTLMAAGHGGAEPRRTAVAPARLALLAGVYADPTGVRRKVIAADGHLFSQRDGAPRYEIHPMSESEFFYVNSFVRFTFQRGADGRATGLVESGEGPTQTWTRVGDLPVRKSISVAPEILETYVGRYEIRPGNTLTVTREGGRLFGQPSAGAKDEFKATTDTDFFIESGDTGFRFVRDAAGKVTAVLLHEGDWSLEAKRLP